MVTVGNMQGVATAYQGSGLENGTSPKVTTTGKEPVVQEAPRRPEQGTAPLEVKEAQQNDAANIKRAVEQINKKAKNSEAVFGIHDATNRVTIKIVDKETKEVIKEFPPEETLDMIAKAWELAGLMVDEKR